MIATDPYSTNPSGGKSRLIKFNDSPVQPQVLCIHRCVRCDACRNVVGYIQYCPLINTYIYEVSQKIADFFHHFFPLSFIRSFYRYFPMDLSHVMMVDAAMHDDDDDLGIILHAMPAATSCLPAL